MSTSPSKINSIDDIDDGLEFFDIPEEAPDSGPAELPSPQAAPAPLSPDGMEMPETQPPHPSMSGASSVDVGADPVYSKWVPDIRDPLEPLEAFRGPWTRPVRIASLVGGLGSERQVLKVFEVPTETILSCDKRNPPSRFKSVITNVGSITCWTPQTCWSLATITCNSGVCTTSLVCAHCQPSCPCSSTYFLFRRHAARSAGREQAVRKGRSRTTTSNASKLSGLLYELYCCWRAFPNRTQALACRSPCATRSVRLTHFWQR